MAVERIVRVIRVWDVPVQAEYGDQDHELIERAKAGTIAEAAEHKILLLPDEGGVA